MSDASRCSTSSVMGRSCAWGRRGFRRPQSNNAVERASRALRPQWRRHCPCWLNPQRGLLPAAWADGLQALTSQTSYLSLGRAHEPRADVVELVEVSIPDAQGSALARAGLDLNLKAQRVRQILLKGTGIGILVAAVAVMGFATL